MCDDKYCTSTAQVLHKQNDLIRTALFELRTIAPKYTHRKLICSISPKKNLGRNSLKRLVWNRMKNVSQKQEDQ
jgi:hypothetical protein